MAQPDRVVLRDWESGDAPAIAPMVADPHIQRWSSLGTGVQAWIERQRSGVRGPSKAICVNDQHQAVGKIALRLPGHASPATTAAAMRPEDHPAGELSYWLVPAARGRGLAERAVRCLLETTVPDTGLVSVVLDVETTNAPSIRLAERLGADRRSPERTERDRSGVERRLIVFVLPVGLRL